MKAPKLLHRFPPDIFKQSQAILRRGNGIKIN